MENYIEVWLCSWVRGAVVLSPTAFNLRMLGPNRYLLNYEGVKPGFVTYSHATTQIDFKEERTSFI